MPGNRQEPFPYLCFFSLPIFITLVPFNKLIIVAIVIASPHNSICSCLTNQSGTYSSKHRSSLTALSHIDYVLKRSGTSGKKRGSMSTSLALMRIKYIHGNDLWRRTTTPSCVPWDPKIYSIMRDKARRIHHPMIYKMIKQYTKYLKNVFIVLLIDF